MSEYDVSRFLTKKLIKPSRFLQSAQYENSFNSTLFITLFLFNSLYLFAQSPTVSNVMFSQRTDGTHIVDIYYDVNNSGGGAMTVTMEVSDDNGVTWNFPCEQINGDLGAGITSGTNKHIVWNFASEHPQTFGDQFIIKIIADGSGLGLPCPGIPTVTYAGKTYNTVLISSQCWLKENLDVGTMIHGTQNSTNNGIIEKYCYNNDPNNCNTYGGLYQWNEAMQYSTTPGTQGICPPGWHIPTLTEFQTLATTAGNDGNALKAVGQGSGGGAGTNTSGFTALLAGTKHSNFFEGLGSGGFFWSSSMYYTNSIYRMGLYSSGNAIQFYNTSYDYGFSVRCLKN